jgi:hypothetical protein
MTKIIRVFKTETGYEVVETKGPEGTTTPVCCADADALRAVLRSMGSTDIGATNVLRELESYRHAELRL